MPNHFVQFHNNKGNRNHYYHFFFGIYLPLSKYLIDQGFESEFDLFVRDCKEMNRHLVSHPFISSRHQLHIIPDSAFPADTLNIKGIDDAPNKMKAFFQETKLTVRQALLQRFKADQDPTRNTIVIARSNPKPNEYPGESTGAARRYMANQNEIVTRLCEELHDVHILTLECMSLAEQARHFSKARVVVGQHGAGLSNIYFCQPECRIVELGANGRRHYFNLAKLLGLKYKHVRTQPGREGPCFADPDSVVTAVDAAFRH